MLVSGKKNLDLDLVETSALLAGLRPCTAGRSYRRKRPPPQFPKSILSIKSLRGLMYCVRGKTLFLCESLGGSQGVPGQEKRRAESEKKRKRNVSKLV